MSAFELYRADIYKEVRQGAHPELIALKEAVKLELKSESVGDGAKSEDPEIRTGTFSWSKRGNPMFHPKIQEHIASMFETISDESANATKRMPALRGQKHIWTVCLRKRLKN